MLIEESNIKIANQSLCILADYIGTQSKLNLNDASVCAENFIARLLNIAYGYKLENINLIKQNASVIDLYDKENKISVQVTSSSNLAKSKSCFENFLKYKLYEKYNELYIYILTTKQKSYKIESYIKGNYSFNPKINIIDKTDLLRKFQGLDPLLQKEFLSILNEGLQTNNVQNNQKSSNEVSTLCNVITLLSEKIGTNNLDINCEIDPQRKIPLRFRNKADLIEEQFFNLSLKYQPILDDVLYNSDIDSNMHSKISFYLKDKSSELLFKNDMDAEKSLKELIIFVEKIFNDASLCYDEMAIKFYLIKHLTLCNVFPLTRKELCQI